MTEISVIIPTLNRAVYLEQAVASMLNQDLPPACYEIIIVDNGSVDETRSVSHQISLRYASTVTYVYESKPGLHNARHRGAREAQGDILVFVDDDIIAAPQWLGTIHKAFKDPDVALVGGKILPKWEGKVPQWIEQFKIQTDYGWTIGYLSLLDFGTMRKDIPAGYVYGCNYSIRKSVLYECGGFHPDAMPRELIRYRGDGESGLSRKITEKGYRTVYEPEATVYHRVPDERLRVEYLCRRYFNQGVSDSYAEIRRNGGVHGSEGKEKDGGILSRLIRIVREKPVAKKVRRSYLEGKEFHRKSVKAEPDLLSYVMRETYF